MSVVIRSTRLKKFSCLDETSRNPSSDMMAKVAYVFLQLLDLLLTLIGTSLGFSEMNIVMRSLLHSPLQLVMVKVVIPLVIARFVPGRYLVPAIALLLLVVCWDIKQLLFLWF